LAWGPEERQAALDRLGAARNPRMARRRYSASKGTRPLFISALSQVY
jgi:hypothetical protein